MRGGFLNTQQTLLNLSGNTAAISTIQTGSTIVGINISGSSRTYENDIPITWEGTFFGQDTSWLSISENQVVTRVGPDTDSARHATIYTLETPSGSLSVDDTEYILVAKSAELGTEVWNEETQTHDIEYTDGFTVGFEKLDGIEFGNEDSTENHYLIRLKDDNSSFEYVPIIRGFEEVNTENPNLLGKFEIKQIDIEESDLYLINRFIVHNFFGENGDSACNIQYNNSQRCTSPFNYVNLAFHSTAANNVVKIGSVCYSLGNAAFVDGSALCIDNDDVQFFSNCSSCTDSDSSFGPTGPQGAQGSAGFSGSPGGTGPAGAQGAKGNQGATGSTGAQGAAGNKGAKGNTGRTGRTGAVNPDPPSGSMGAKGNTGLTGQKGASGNTGPAGATGAKGNTGAAGAKG